VLVLAGDIMVANTLTTNQPMPVADRYRRFLSQCSAEFEHVIYIAGNHEFYHGDWNGTLNTLRDECNQYANVYFMEADHRDIRGLRFVGATLWTDMNREDPMTLHAVTRMMSDFSVISNQANLHSQRLMPLDTVNRHRRTLEYISHVAAVDHAQPMVVVGHHCPSQLSVHKQYHDQFLMNGAYRSDLSEFILDRPQIRLWCHGHTHHNFDYHIGTTRIVCNPRGYAGHEARADTWQLQYINIDANVELPPRTHNEGKTGPIS
jgi:UDP-2,3-diacylglucosamine pyrophosphatase LpxH